MSPRLNMLEVHDVQEIYHQVQKEISTRCREFKCLWIEGDRETIFSELVFCLLTPQSKARACAAAVERLKERDLLLRGGKGRISKELVGVRFHNNKARYIVEARKRFMGAGKPGIKEVIDGFESGMEAREWLVENIKGLGYKEASHFLRNVGFCDELAILDRHILKNLVRLGVIDEMPKSLGKNRYLEIEERLKKASNRMGILPAHLDLVLWYREAKEVFK